VTPTADLRGQLSWSRHRVRDRLIFKNPELRYVIRALAPGGAYDLALYLWLIASMQYVPETDSREATATVAQSYLSIAKAIGMPSATSTTTLSGKVTRMVGRLVAARLVRTERVPGRGTVIRLLNPGSSEPYVMPDPRRPGGKVFMPGYFFSQGWHTVLPKPALALLLAGCVEETKQWGKFGAKERPGCWSMPRDEIEREYRIHHDAIDKAKRVLAELGLMRFEFDELNDESRIFPYTPSHTYWIDKDVWKLTPAEAPHYELKYEGDGALDTRSMTWLKLKQPKFRVAARDRKVVPLLREGRA
jgi:hypothetical protein